MPKIKQYSLKTLAGIEVETMADYWGQGVLYVAYSDEITSKPKFHPIKNAYDNFIARAVDEENPLCMTTDSNRSEEGNKYPKRTCIEFRSGPTKEHNEELLRLIQAYNTWLIQQKEQLRESQFRQFDSANRQEKNALHHLKLSDFIHYYNQLKSTINELVLSLPHTVFDPEHAGPDFEYSFPCDAEWVLQLEYKDLDPAFTAPVFTSQYNLSLPIGCIFEPAVKNSFPQQQQLLPHEKEIAANFNESAPHAKLAQYEQAVFTAAVELADVFFTNQNLPIAAIGVKDFLRGMAYEIALISTSQHYLIELFQEDALWIATQQELNSRNNREKMPRKKEIRDTAVSLANTLNKSIFPYFMKATLADFFKQLQSFEQEALQAIPRKKIKEFCRQASKIANGGNGNNIEHPGHLILNYDSFMELFNDFYKQTFQGVAVREDENPADPIAFLTDRFIPSVNLGINCKPVNALVIELRMPAQGNQQYKDILDLYHQFGRVHQEILQCFVSEKSMSASFLSAVTRVDNTPIQPESGRKRKAQQLSKHGIFALRPHDDDEPKNKKKRSWCSLQ